MAATAIRPIPIPHRTPPTTEQATVMGRTTAATAIRATPPHLTIPALLSASGGVTRVVRLSEPERRPRLVGDHERLALTPRRRAPPPSAAARSHTSPRRTAWRAFRRSG